MTYDRQLLAELLSNAIAKDETQRDSTKASIEALLSLLDFYKINQEPMVKIAGSAADIRPPMLAFHLIRNAREYGIDHAILGLDELLALTVHDTITVAYVDNVQTNVTVDLGDNVFALPDDQAPNEHFSQAILDSRSKLVSRRGAIIAATQTQKPFHVLPKGVDFPQAVSKMDMAAPGMERIERAVRLLTLNGPSAPVIRTAGSFLSSPSSRLFAKPTGASFRYSSVGYAPEMPATITSKTAQILPLCNALSASDQKRVDNAITRLNRAVASLGIEDAIVEAVIAIESLVGDGNSELSYRVRLRCALLLETQLKKRLAVSAFVKKLYGERSSIVHTGSSKKGDYELARQGRDIAHRLIERVLELGRIPIWEELELGGGPHP